MSSAIETIEDAEVVASDAAPATSTSLAVRGAKADSNTQVGLTTESAFSLAQRAASLLCSSSLVPAMYQGQDNMANCVIALHMAARMKADPLMVMQNLYVIQGKPSWSSQFLIATFNSCGQFSKIRYRMTGTKGQDDYGCIAFATELATGEQLEGSEVTVAIAKQEGWFSKSGSKWRTMPEQMLKYRAATWLIRSIAPELAMGLHTADETEDISSLDVPVTPKAPAEPSKPPIDPMDFLKQKAAATTAPAPASPALVEQPAPTAPTAPAQATFTPEPGFCTLEQKQTIEYQFMRLGFDIEAQKTVLGKRGVSAVRSLTEQQAADLIAAMWTKLEGLANPKPQPEPTPTSQAPVQPGEGAFAGGEPTEPGQMIRDIQGPCSPEQLKQIEDAMMQLEQTKPGATEALVANLDKAQIALSYLTYVQADGLLAAIMIQEIEAFFDHQLGLQPA